MTRDERTPHRYAILAAAALIAAVLVGARRHRPDDVPFQPRTDGEVLERIAAGSGADPAADELRSLEARLARAPTDVALAVEVARRHVAAARRSGDARRLSYAEAALEPLAAAQPVPTPVLLWRAIVRQARHEFDAALGDLDALLARRPDDVEARRVRSAILTVLARYDEARRDCASPVQLAFVPPDPLCTAPIDAVTGHADRARAQLALRTASPAASREEVAWGRALLGEASLYDGAPAAAEASLRAALDLDPEDTYARGLLADALLDAERPADVLAIVASDEPNDVLLLRRAIAIRRLGAPGADALAAQLRARDGELRLRGDVTHRREEARRRLALDGDAEGALALAAANFAAQREPLDARVLLEAAAAVLAAHPERRAEVLALAAPALEWLRATGCGWPPLRRAAAALGEARP